MLKGRKLRLKGITGFPQEHLTSNGANPKKVLLLMTELCPFLTGDRTDLRDSGTEVLQVNVSNSFPWPVVGNALDSVLATGQEHQRTPIVVDVPFL